jgi:hypothetical protein
MFGCRLPGQRCTGALAALLPAELLSSEWRIAMAQIVSEVLIGRLRTSTIATTLFRDKIEQFKN